MENQKRYTLNLDLFIYSKNDDEAIRIADQIKKILNDNDDCNAKILSIHETPFGIIGEARNIILWGGQRDFEKEKENKGYRRIDLEKMEY